MRRSGPWLISIPLMIAGSQVAHALAYRLAYPQAQVRWRVLESTGHGYLAFLPLAAGIVGAVLLAGCLVIVADAARRREPGPMPAWAFALLPILGFTVQEFTERWLAGSDFPWWMVLQPTFRIGLVLQLPIGLVVFALVALLVRIARRIGAALIGRTPAPVFAAAAVVSSTGVCLPRLSSLSLGWSLRGPPLPPV